MKRILNFSLFYLILELAAGVYYREFTKINGFEGQTALKGVHPHSLVLGFLFLLILVILAKVFEVHKEKNFNKFFVLYNISLIYVILAMLVRGTAQVMGVDIAGLNHIAGLGHAMLGVALVWGMVIVRKAVK